MRPASMPLDLPIPDHFRYCPRCGSQSLGPAEPDRNPVHCSACGFTLYFNPSSSAGALILDSAGKLLVVKRAREPAKGKFGIPGGFVDPGESLEETVAREVREEVNLELRNLRFFASFPNDYHYKGVIYAVTDTYFTAQVDSFASLAPEHDEVTGIQFVDPKTTPPSQYAFDSLRAAVKRLNGPQNLSTP